jgi:PPP family 3-phenylpropionic acid transporter
VNAGAATRLALFYGAVFAIVGVQLPFWPVFLASRGMSPAEIGALLALPLWVKVVANPVAGIAADRLGTRRRLMACLAVAALGGYAAFALADGFWALVGATVLTAAVFSPLLPLGENLAVATAYAQKFDYGRVRLWGSLSFIAAALLSGKVLDGLEAEWILWLVAGFATLTFLTCLSLPQTPGSGPSTLAPGLLLRDRRLLLFFAAATLIQASHAVYYAFGTLHWRALGHGPGAIGLLWSEGVIAEIVLFWFGAPLVARLGPRGLLVLGGIAALLRWSGTAFAESLPLLALLQVMHAFTFGAVHLGAMHFLQRNVPSQLSATGQALYAAICSGIGFGVAMLASGALWSAAGPLAFAVMAAMGLAGAALALRLRD